MTLVLDVVLLNYFVQRWRPSYALRPKTLLLRQLMVSKVLLGEEKVDDALLALFLQLYLLLGAS